MSSTTSGMLFELMEPNLRPRLQHRTLDARAGPTPIEITPPHRLESLSPHDRNDIKSYATKALVPYVKDDELPSFSGAQGAVYRATQTITYGLLRRDRVEAFAIKEIRLEDIRARERLRNEIKHLRLCDHPNILRLREAYTIEQEQWIDTTFLVTEPWAQTSLQRFLQSVAKEGRSSSCPWYFPQNLDPWPSIVRQCILGVKHLHENSIKHKDLKPDNILLLDESNGDYLHPKVRPIIADLGISKKYVVGARTTFQGTYQYLAPEQIAKEASTLESDIFSLGCCFAWIHSVLSSKPWDENKPHEQGPSQLDELVCVGFANTAVEIPSLLERLRMDRESPKRPETVEFLLAMEEMIARMLIVAPSQRAKLENLLERLDTYEDRCHLFKKKKTVYFCLTSPQTTNVIELDVSDILTDSDFFNHVRNCILPSCNYLKHFSLNKMLFERIGILLGDLGIDVRFIKFIVQDGVFSVLEGPSSVPSTSVLEAEYDYDPSTEVPIPKDVFIHKLLSSPPSLDSIWFDRIPKRVQIISSHQGRSRKMTSQVPKEVGWGIQIVQDNLSLSPQMLIKKKFSHMFVIGFKVVFHISLSWFWHERRPFDVVAISLIPLLWDCCTVCCMLFYFNLFFSFFLSSVLSSFFLSFFLPPLFFSLRQMLMFRNDLGYWFFFGILGGLGQLCRTMSSALVNLR